MKIFIINGKVKGMAKLGDKLNLTGNEIEQVDKVILSGSYCMKVVEKSQLRYAVEDSNFDDIILLASDDSVLGTGSVCGKTDVEKIMLQYRIQYCKNSNESELNKNIVEEKPSVETTLELSINQSKIDTKLQDKDDFLQDNELICDTKSMKNDACESESSKDLSNDLNEVCDEKVLEDFISLNEEKHVYDDVDSIEVKEIILSTNEDIERGVEFVMEQMKNNEQKANFYTQIKSDLDKFLRSYPRNEELENKVFSSKWVKITTDYDYSVGIIFEDDTPAIIAYAEPYENKSQVDVSKLQLGEWLKIDPASNRGYFIFYQNAETGEMILNTNY